MDGLWLGEVRLNSLISQDSFFGSSEARDRLRDITQSEEYFYAVRLSGAGYSRAHTPRWAEDNDISRAHDKRREIRLSI